MKYLKKYNEDIDWKFDEEEIDKIYDGTFYLFLYEYSDNYSYYINGKHYRIFLGLDRDHMIRDFNRNEIIFTDNAINKKIHNPNIIEGIKKNDSYITNNYGTSYHGFKKWKFSELDSILNINKKYLFIHN